MEYLTCGNLEQQTHFTFSETEAMLEQQLAAVAYLHGIGITHRDIKPENILVESRSPNLITKLSDFGLSSDRDLLETFCGTKYYLAPEVVRKRREYTSRVDIWSLGTVALEFAYSRPEALRKWNRRDWSNAVHYHAHEQHGTLATLLQKMLSLRPSARPSADGCLLEMVSWNLVPSSPPPQSATTLRQTDLPTTKIPEEKPQRVRHHQNIHLPQGRVVTARLGRPPDLFGAISSERDIETKVRALLDSKSKGEGKRKRKEQNDGKAKLRMVAIDEESNHDTEKNTDESEAETFRLQTKDGTNSEDEIQSGIR